MYGHDLGSTRFSPLKQINAQNVSNLSKAWSYDMRPGGNGPASAAYAEVTPIVVNGVMYLPAGNKVVALDGDSGKEIWRFELKTGLASARGVAYWPGTRHHAARIFFTSGHKIMALDATTGKPAAGFGPDGSITLKVPFAEVPTIYKNIIIIGANVYGPGETNLHPQDEVGKGVPGDSRAFSAITGKKLWDFHTVPHPGEVGNNTWGDDSWKDRGGANVWSITMSVDAKRGILYMPVGGPAANYYGGDRPGDNLFSNTLVAVNANTGKLKWYFQFSPHNLYDYDAVQTPVLVNASFKGRPRKLIVTANRNGFLYILDRTNGHFLFAKQFAQQLNWATGIDENGRPISAGLIPDEKGVKVCPANGGATNWYSPSYNPATRMFYFRSYDDCAVFRARPTAFEPGAGFYATGARLSNEPGKGYINAFDLEKLDFAWRDKQIGSYKGWGGVMSTASGLVAYGDDAQNFVVLNGRTGRPLWHFHVGQLIHASPMSYAVRGKQYFAVAAGSDVFAFALP